MKKSFFLFLLFPLLLSAQILDHFPANQSPYFGGYEAYYKDFHEIIVAKDLKKCANSGEFYQLNLLINKDASVSFIKDYNTKNIENNKCAYDLAREIAQYQKGWNVAEVNGDAQSAVATFLIFPDDLFENYRENYIPNFSFPRYNNYEGTGAKEFRKGIVNRIDTRRFDWNDRFEIIVDFTITKESTLENFIVIKSSSLAELDNQVVFGIKSTRKLWKAAMINGKTVDYIYRLKLNAVTDPL